MPLGIGSPFNDLAEEQRWVAWHNELRGGKPAKVPYAPNGKRAKADDSTTWGTRLEAEACAAKIMNGGVGGIGIELGDLGGDAFLAGIDLDSCIGEYGVLAAWAARILNAAYSYTEVSPSGRGLKVFFYVPSEEVRPFLERIGADPQQWGVRRDVPGQDAREHGPAVEVYFSHRYFAVTEEQWPTAPNTLAMLDHKLLDQLALHNPVCPVARRANRRAKSR
jgi:putative DNA primase/helicase